MPWLLPARGLSAGNELTLILRGLSKGRSEFNHPQHPLHELMWHSCCQEPPGDVFGVPGGIAPSRAAPCPGGARRVTEGFVLAAPCPVALVVLFLS